MTPPSGRGDPEPAHVLRDRLRVALSGPLPGEEAHRKLLPPGYREHRMPAETRVIDSAVLIALQVRGAGCRFPLVVRPSTMARHAGQIGLPGGVMEGHESAAECALREAREEIGLPRSAVQLLGGLSPILIPVSGYRVATFVGWIADPTPLRPQADEVLEILMADPDRLVAEGPESRVEVERSGTRVLFPAYDVEGRAVWGATGIILAEFLEIWRGARAA